MTNNIIDVLTFMFDFLFESAEQDSSQEFDDHRLKTHLSEAGFDADRIEKALVWLENIAALQDGKIASFDTFHNSMRIYSEHEKTKLDSRARGFIMFMENMGTHNASQRQIVIDQVMALEYSKLSIDDLKWVVMMVIGNSTESTVPSQWIESIVFYDDNPTLQ
jgi:Smg protein